jgi:signal transduction histidine kinase
MIGYEIDDAMSDRDKTPSELIFLDEASTAILSSTDPDQILHALLTAITMGEGLGFNRAMLFLFDQNAKTLKGQMAIGPDNPAQAQRVWSRLPVKPGQKLSHRIEELRVRSDGSKLNGMVQKMRIPVDGSRCILERTLREGRSFHVRIRCDTEHDKSLTCPIEDHPPLSHACAIHRRIMPRNGEYHCAVVPLWGRGRAIGAISVDNIFNLRPIRREDLQLLEIFAKHGGLAIEHGMVLRGIETSQRELRRNQEILIQNEKMAALQQMAADVAHAIKNPLVSIGGFARRLDKTLHQDGSARKYTQTMIREAARLEGILDGIFQYSINAKPRLGTHDLNEIIGNALNDILENRGEFDIQILRDLNPSIPKIYCDDKQIRQTIFNVLSNAVDAMNGRGELSVRTYTSEQNDRAWVVAEIVDSGGGMSQDVLQNIFNPFFSTHGKEPGLGLAICHRIITSHHGSIDVDNRPGKGVRFIIRLPQNHA